MDQINADPKIGIDWKECTKGRKEVLFWKTVRQGCSLLLILFNSYTKYLTNKTPEGLAQASK